jgi:hypothetical protein
MRHTIRNQMAVCRKCLIPAWPIQSENTGAHVLTARGAPQRCQLMQDECVHVLRSGFHLILGAQGVSRGDAAGCAQITRCIATIMYGQVWTFPTDTRQDWRTGRLARQRHENANAGRVPQPPTMRLALRAIHGQLGRGWLRDCLAVQLYAVSMHPPLFKPHPLCKQVRRHDGSCSCPCPGSAARRLIQGQEIGMRHTWRCNVAWSAAALAVTSTALCVI